MRRLIVVLIVALIVAGALPVTAAAQSTIYQTLPGTGIRDYSQPGLRVDPGYGGRTVNVYPTLPGTNIRDFSRSGYRYERDYSGRIKGYPTLPGTNIRDFSQPGFVID
jgi:hypothetical protein